MSTNRPDTEPANNGKVVLHVRSNGSASQLPRFLFQIRETLLARIQAMSGTWKETRVVITVPELVDKEDIRRQLLGMIEVKQVQLGNGKGMSGDLYPVIDVVLNPESKIEWLISKGLTSENIDRLLIDNVLSINGSSPDVILLIDHSWLDRYIC